MGSKFVIADPRKCVGCKACMAACLVKHFVPGDVPIARLNVVKVGEDMTAPILCHHCEDAPCAASCPTGALYRDDDRVAVRMSQCIGCRSCVVACPFGAVTVTERYGTSQLGKLSVGSGPRAVVVKCDRCVDRENGPACIEACTSHALRLVTQDELDANVLDKRSTASVAAKEMASAQ
jgi:Fe-S-cluster-containing hydrogenase component 2